jgi:transcriptional antiterminator RfaH
MSFNWYVLRVKPHKERAVLAQLEIRDVDVYFPVLKVNPVNPRAARERPYFPGYMFVRVNLTDLGANALRWVPGAHGLVEFGGVPAVVPTNLIQEIEKRLVKIEARGGLTLSKLKRGDRVRITGGLFAGYEAIFDERLPGNQRVQVLLSFLSNFPQPVKLDADDIKKLGN